MDGLVRGRRLKRLALILGVAVALLSAALVLALARPWERSAPRSAEVRVDRATLRSGEVVLVLANDSEEPARVAQVIVNDAFVDFRQSQRVLQPGDAERITVAYPWISGESYEVRLMTATGATVDYELEEAEAGARSA
jgi:ZIP family zinc transporter